jgi:hypothetical protein
MILIVQDDENTIQYVMKAPDDLDSWQIHNIMEDSFKEARQSSDWSYSDVKDILVKKGFAPEQNVIWKE